MGLAVVRSLGAPRRLQTTQQAEDFEQELVDQYLLAALGSGLGDGTVAADRAVLFEFIGFLGRPVWTAQPHDADRFLALQRKQLQRSRLTVQRKAWALARFFEFLVARYQGDIHTLTGCVVAQVIDEYNRPAQADYGTPRVPPSAEEVEVLFSAWREHLPAARKFLPAARDYLAASLWRRVGLRIQETYMLDLRDWRRDLGEHGKLHVRFARAAAAAAPRPAWSQRSTRPGRCWTGGSARSATSSATTGLTRTRRCCQANAATRTPGTAAAPATRRSATGWPPRSAAGCRAGTGGWCRTRCDTSAPRRCTRVAWTSRPSRSCSATSGCRPPPATSTSTPTTSSTPGRRPTSEWPPASATSRRGELVRWNLRMKAAERGIWKSTELRRRLAEAGLEISAGKMSALWTTTPTTIRLDDLDVLCVVLECSPTDLLICEPDKVAARTPPTAEAGALAPITPRLGRHRSVPPA
jgi:DNA-binding Xre family transcriptional regulator/integrase